MEINEKAFDVFKNMILNQMMATLAPDEESSEATLKLLKSANKHGISTEKFIEILRDAFTDSDEVKES